MEENLAARLKYLADKYETPQFLIKDPSQFMHRYSSADDVEVAAFIASSLAFGNRKQILLASEKIFSHIDSDVWITSSDEKKSPAQWIRCGAFNSFFKKSDESYYRVFTHNNMISMCCVLQEILLAYKTLGEYFYEQYKTAVEEKNYFTSENNCGGIPLYEIVRKPFLERGCGNLVPYTKSSSCKRLQLFLRWMVRNDSPVDCGLWNWYSKKNLLIPLDVHVLQESCKLGLINRTESGKIPGATIRMCFELTEQLKSVWPDDPCKGDYALFGLGAD